MDFITPFVTTLATQGLGYLLAVIEGFVIYLLWKNNRDTEKEYTAELKDINERRTADYKQMQDIYYNKMEALQNAYFENLDGVKQLSQSTLTIVQNLQQLFNLRKK